MVVPAVAVDETELIEVWKRNKPEVHIMIKLLNSDQDVRMPPFF